MTEFEDLFCIDPSITYFNASYGVVPKKVRAAHEALLDECEANPYAWSTRVYHEKVTRVKNRLSDLLVCESQDLVMLDNSSSAANSIFDAIDFTVKNATIVLLETAYGLIINLAKKYAQWYDLKIVYVPVNAAKTDAVCYDLADTIDELHATGYKVCLACVDHISSCPALHMPVTRMAEVCRERGVDVLVDGAHALGQVRVNLTDMSRAGVTYWFADAHKWFYSPKGSAVMWVRRDKQVHVRPAIDCTSDTPNRCIVLRDTDNIQTSNTAFEKRFLYLGTKDYTPWIAVGAALDFVEERGGYDAVIERNRNVATFIQKYLALGLNDDRIEPKDTLEISMSNIPLAFVKNETDAIRFVNHLESRQIYTVVFRYRNTFWMRLCVQLFIDVLHVVRLRQAITEYIQKITVNDSRT